jgi:hypothetical protein
MEESIAKTAGSVEYPVCAAAVLRARICACFLRAVRDVPARRVCAEQHPHTRRRGLCPRRRQPDLEDRLDAALLRTRKGLLCDGHATRPALQRNRTHHNNPKLQGRQADSHRHSRSARFTRECTNSLQSIYLHLTDYRFVSQWRMLSPTLNSKRRT